jgi:hypothetical protein
MARRRDGKAMRINKTEQNVRTRPRNMVGPQSKTTQKEMATQRTASRQGNKAARQDVTTRRESTDRQGNGVSKHATALQRGQGDGKARPEAKSAATRAWERPGKEGKATLQRREQDDGQAKRAERQRGQLGGGTSEGGGATFKDAQALSSEHRQRPVSKQSSDRDEIWNIYYRE